MTTLRAVWLCIALATPMPGQIPRGHGVVSSLTNGLGAANHGVATFHSMNPGAVAPLTGLPAALTGSGSSYAGAASILVDDLTGSLVVGEVALPGTALDVHVIDLAGTATTSIRSYPLGTVGPFGVQANVSDMAWLRSDILVLAGWDLASGPLAGAQLGLVRPYLGPPGTAGTVVPLPLTAPLMGGAVAIAVDAPTDSAFVAAIYSTGPAYVFSTRIYRVPLVPPHTPVLLASIPDHVASLALDSDGRLVAGTLAPPWLTLNSLYAIDVATGAFVVSGPAWATPVYAVQGITLDSITGDLVIASDTSASVVRVPRLGGGAYGSPIPLATGVTQFVSGIAVRPAVSTYGHGTPGVETYEWRAARLPGGAPTLGNANFQLALAPTLGGAPAILGLSGGTPTPARLWLPVGITLLLEPASTTLFGLGPTPTVLALPIPASPTLAGVNCFLQTAHLEPGGLAASNGLWLTPF